MKSSVSAAKRRRRRILAGWLAVAVALGAANPVVAEEQSWKFKVSLDDKEIGFHRFILTGQGLEKTLRSEAQFTVKFLGLNAYSYRHTADEQWRGDCLKVLTAQTRDGGKNSTVTAVTRADTLEVTSLKAPLSISGCVMTFAYWNPVMLNQRRLLNPQTGEYVDVAVSKRGLQRMEVRGRQVQAQQYHLDAGELQIDLWYSPEGDWLALESMAKGNRRLRYQLQ